MTDNIREKPFTLPEPEGAVEEYIVVLKPDAPFDFCTLGGMSINKNTLPEEATLVENEDNKYAPTVLVRKLAPNQLQALRNEANKRTIQVPIGAYLTTYQVKKTSKEK